jgi:maltose alpha-D-glucosyltransferase/alpha-amylase
MTDRRYLGARVIFGDVETSNWARDPLAGAYYWRRRMPWLSRILGSGA